MTPQSSGTSAKKALTRRRAASPSRKTKSISRKTGAADSRTRTSILDAAERLMRRAGFAAVTSRRIGQEAGVRAALIHYYFKTMDDLFLALWRRYADERIARYVEAAASPRPLRALWEFSYDTPDVTLGIEFMALARSRNAIRAELARTSETIHRMQTETLRRILPRRKRKLAVSPELMSALITGLARFLALEQELGVTSGQKDIPKEVAALLERLWGSHR